METQDLRLPGEKKITRAEKAKLFRITRRPFFHENFKLDKSRGCFASRLLKFSLQKGTLGYWGIDRHIASTHTQQSFRQYMKTRAHASEA